MFSLFASLLVVSLIIPLISLLLVIEKVPLAATPVPLHVRRK